MGQSRRAPAGRQGNEEKREKEKAVSSRPWVKDKVRSQVPRAEHSGDRRGGA